MSAEYTISARWASFPPEQLMTKTALSTVVLLLQMIAKADEYT